MKNGAGRREPERTGMGGEIMDKVALRYQDWERVLRSFIEKAEEQRALGAVEVAKSLLLYGMKLYQDLLSSALSEKDRLAFVNEMRRRTGVVLQHCMKQSALGEFPPEA
jgi:hypothetical protein